MLYEDTYQTGGDPNVHDISVALFDHSGLEPEEKTGYPSHSHAFYEMDYTLDGYAEFEFSNRVVRAEAGTLLFFHPLCIHSIPCDRREHNLSIQFSARLMKNSLQDPRPSQMLLLHPDFVQRTLPVSPTVEYYLQKLAGCSPRLPIPYPENYRQLVKLPPEKKMAQMGFLTLILAELLDSGCLQIVNVEFHPDRFSKMNNLLKMIMEHPETRISMEDAAAFVGMGYSNFCRTFKTTVGDSYVDFVNYIRCVRAKEMLNQTELSVTEISMRLGFGSVSYFNRIFKKFAGRTPLDYRQNRTG